MENLLNISDWFSVPAQTVNSADKVDLAPDTYVQDHVQTGTSSFPGGFGVGGYGYSNLHAASVPILKTMDNLTGGGSQSWKDWLGSNSIAKAVSSILPNNDALVVAGVTLIPSTKQSGDAVLGLPSENNANGGGADWQTVLGNYFVRGAVIIVGFIFIAVGLSMFKSIQSTVVSGVTNAARKAI